MKRILIASTDFMMESFLLPHVKFLAEHDFEVELVCMETEGRLVEVHRALEDYVKDIHPVNPVSGFFHDGKTIRELADVIENGGFHILWANEYPIADLMRMALKKADVASIDFIYMPHGFGTYKLKRKEKKLISACAGVIATTQEDYELLGSDLKCNTEHIHGIGVETGDYAQISNENLADVRAREGFAEGDFVLLCSGDLTKNGNQKTVIEAVNIVKDMIPGLKVIIEGAGEDEIALINLIEDYGLQEIVTMAGAREDLPVLTQAVDVCISAGFVESMPYNVIEAMLCKKPVLASDNIGHRELVEEGVTGHLFEADKEEDLADLMLRMYQKKYAAMKMGIYGYDKIQAYTVEKVSLELLWILEKYQG